MIKASIEKALNEQINAELYSAYIYMSMSAYFKSVNLDGFASWMEIQAQEELMHAKKFYNFILERGGKVTLMPIEGPTTTWANAEKAFETAYEHEQYVSGRINDLVELALKEKDHATNIMLQWFVTEQVEEEANASSVLERIRLAGTSGSGLFMLDREMGQRTFDAAEYTG